MKKILLSIAIGMALMACQHIGQQGKSDIEKQLDNEVCKVWQNRYLV